MCEILSLKKPQSQFDSYLNVVVFSDSLCYIVWDFGLVPNVVEDYALSCVRTDGLWKLQNFNSVLMPWWSLHNVKEILSPEKFLKMWVILYKLGKNPWCSDVVMFCCIQKIPVFTFCSCTY